MGVVAVRVVSGVPGSTAVDTIAGVSVTLDVGASVSL